ncbi:MAG: extracellular solute-binding protein [Erysipelotrichaceae bacterium]|nr:extracellular solute-binding protein [Erysipelotrichaceae bacterium]
MKNIKGFFEKYYTVPEGVTVNWIIVPSDGGAYQAALDEALLNQANADADDKVDMFLAEADYILKYVNSEATQDITQIGVTDMSNTYKYTVEACTDTNGVVKGVSFQCCPSGLVYRRSVAKEVLGTDDPTEVQALLSDWTKFEEVAGQMKEAGYYMTPSFAETYRPFSNNVSSPWVVDGKLNFDAKITEWLDLTDRMNAAGETIPAGILDAEKNEASMLAEAKSFCLFGPAWYFNFCMGPAWEEGTGSLGDWALIEGPAAHFWGGTWLLAPEGTDNPTMLADIMNTFINDEEVCTNLVVQDAQFSNNKAVNAKCAADDELGANELLGGQNATAVFSAMADNIKFQNQTIYDQLLNEGLQAQFQQYLKGTVTRDEAMANFIKYVNETYPSIVTE